MLSDRHQDTAKSQDRARGIDNSKNMLLMGFLALVHDADTLHLSLRDSAFTQAAPQWGVEQIISSDV